MLDNERRANVVVQDAREEYPRLETVNPQEDTSEFPFNVTQNHNQDPLLEELTQDYTDF